MLYQVSFIHPIHNIKAAAVVAADNTENAEAMFKRHFEEAVFQGFYENQMPAVQAAFWDEVKIEVKLRPEQVVRFEWDKQDTRTRNVFKT